MRMPMRMLIMMCSSAVAVVAVVAVAVPGLWADMERDVHNLLADKTNSL